MSTLEKWLDWKTIYFVFLKRLLFGQAVIELPIWGGQPFGGKINQYKSMVIFTDFPCCNALVWVGNIPLVRGNMLVDAGVSIVNVVWFRHQKVTFWNWKETYC